MEGKLKRWMAVGRWEKNEYKLEKEKGKTEKIKGDKNKDDGGEIKKRNREREGGVWPRSLSCRNWSLLPEACH